MPMSLEKQMRLLSMVDVLQTLSEDDLEELAKQVPDTSLEEGEVLYTPQESSERLFILKEGRVQAYEITDDGDEITLSVIESGNVFGEMSLTGQSLKGLYVRALVPSTVCSLKRAQFERLILEHPQVGLELVRVLAKRLHHAESSREDMITKEVPARLATLILRLADSEGLVSGESYRIPTRYTHEQLASMIGCKRVAVSRAFATFRERGVAEKKDRYIHIEDLEGLRELAEAS